MLIKLHQLPTITASNSVIHIGTAIFFDGMPEGVWPINNQSKILYCNFTTHRQVDNGRKEFTGVRSILQHNCTLFCYVHIMVGRRPCITQRPVLGIPEDVGLFGLLLAE